MSFDYPLPNRPHKCQLHGRLVQWYGMSPPIKWIQRRLFLQIKRIRRRRRRPRPKRNFDWLFSPLRRRVGHSRWPRCHSCLLLSSSFTGEEDGGDINRFPPRLSAFLYPIPASRHFCTDWLLRSFVCCSFGGLSSRNVGHLAAIVQIIGSVLY